MEIIFEIDTIHNPRIDISYDFLWYKIQLDPAPLAPSLPGAPLGGTEVTLKINKDNILNPHY